MPQPGSVGHDVLRIEDSPDIARGTRQPLLLRLSGDLVEATLPDLTPSLESARSARRKVELDLGGVVLAERAAAEYLARARGAGVRLLHCLLSLRAWLRMPGHGVERQRERP